MFSITDTAYVPWFVVPSDDKPKAQINTITHLLSQIPYEEIPHEKITLPVRQKPGKYQAPDYPYKFVPDVV